MSQYRRVLNGSQPIGGGAKGVVSFVGNQPNVANLKDLANFSVNWNQWEFITGSLYDSIAYPAAGLNTATMFSIPRGQGTGFGGGVKTLSDTNMDLAGQLSAGQMFIISSVEILVQPTTPTVAANMPAFFGAQGNTVQINDSYIIGRSGNVALNILQKKYLQEAPLGNLPPAADFTLSAAVADIAPNGAGTGNMQSRIGFGNYEGASYVLTPNNLLLTSSQNFNLVLSWPEGLQAITNPARLFTRFNGMFCRLAQ